MAKSENKFSFSNFISFINDHFSLIIIILIVLVLGFLGGSLWTENQMLKSDGVAVVVDQAVEEVAEVDNSLALKNIPEISDKDHIQGSKKADIQMILYSDFQCSYCQRWHPTFNTLIEKYGDQITFVYRHFSLGFSYSDKLAQASECVADIAGEDAFWKFSDKIYEKLIDKSIYTDEEFTNITDDTILTIAANAGASLSQVQSCLKSQEKASVISEMMLGAQSAGIGSTPNTVIVSKKAGRELIPGAISLEEVEALLEKHL